MIEKILKAVVFGIAISVLVALFSSCSSRDVEIYMFANMSECQTLVSKDSHSEVTVYDTPTHDKSVDDLAYNDFYACSYSSTELDFKLFAYIFPDKESAKAYFKNATGQDASKDVFYLDTTGLTTFRRIVINENCAYTIYADKSDAESVIAFINQIFSKKILTVS